MTEDEVVARLESGMTIGIGGWAARRKPMSIVRAILRSDLTDLTIASYGGPDVGMLCASGKVSKLISAFVSDDSIPLRDGDVIEDGRLGDDYVHPNPKGHELAMRALLRWARERSLAR